MYVSMHNEYEAVLRKPYPLIVHRDTFIPEENRKGSDEEYDSYV